MNSSWKSIAGSFVLGIIIAFSYGGFCIYAASRDSALAQSEGSTTAQVSRHTRTSNNQSSWSYKCDYSFAVNGAIYHGYENCPDLNKSSSAKETLTDLAGPPQSFTTSVYFDPSDPSTNSLTEFGAKSESDSLRARLSMGIGVIFIILLVLGMVITSAVNKGDGGIVVDEAGTVIYPDKADSSQQE
jgi:hypothetical protein